MDARSQPPRGASGDTLGAVTVIRVQHVLLPGTRWRITEDAATR